MPLPSGPSGSATYFPDFLELIQEASAIACVDMTSGEAARSARRSLELMLMDLSNEGLNQFSLDFQLLPLTAGVSHYALPLDTSDVITASIRVTATDGTFTDTVMNRIDFASYAIFPNKQQQGKPSQIFVHRKNNPEIHVWMVPDNNQTYSIAYWRMRRMDSTGSYTNSCDVPYRFIPVMIAGLALRLAMKSRDANVLNRIPLLKADYQEALTKAKREDRDRSSIFIAPLLEY